MITFQHRHLLPCLSYLLWKTTHTQKVIKSQASFLSYIIKVCIHTCGCAHMDCVCTHIGWNGCLTSFLRTGWSWSRIWAVLFHYVVHQKLFPTSCQTPPTEKLVLHMLLLFQMCRQFLLLWSHKSRLWIIFWVFLVQAFWNHNTHSIPVHGCTSIISA